MPSANVEVMRRATDAFGRGDMETMLREAASDIEVSDPERTGVGPFRGRDAFVAWLEECKTGRESGIELEEHWAHVYALGQGRIARFEAFRSREEALEALAYPDRP